LLKFLKNATHDRLETDRSHYLTETPLHCLQYRYDLQFEFTCIAILDVSNCATISFCESRPFGSAAKAGIAKAPIINMATIAVLGIAVKPTFPKIPKTKCQKYKRSHSSHSRLSARNLFHFV